MIVAVWNVLNHNSLTQVSKTNKMDTLSEVKCSKRECCKRFSLFWDRHLRRRRAVTQTHTHTHTHTHHTHSVLTPWFTLLQSWHEASRSNVCLISLTHSVENFCWCGGTHAYWGNRAWVNGDYRQQEYTHRQQEGKNTHTHTDWYHRCITHSPRLRSQLEFFHVLLFSLALHGPYVRKEDVYVCIYTYIICT